MEALYPFAWIVFFALVAVTIAVIADARTPQVREEESRVRTFTRRWTERLRRPSSSSADSHDEVDGLVADLEREMHHRRVIRPSSGFGPVH